ncbi:MAG: hypothetical protein JW885_05070 [Deltaproteobacteria bacterium]|nr:hypothetical protein [Candidatus Zymogenaceae bacterium]
MTQDIAGGPIQPEKKHSPLGFFCAACSIILLVTILMLVLFGFLVSRSCEKTFEVPEIFGPETPTVPDQDQSRPTPPETIPFWDRGSVPAHVILDEGKDSLSVGVDEDISQKDIEDLNEYLAGTYFAGSEMFNISYVNRDDPDSGEVIAVYNFNYYTGTDRLTVLEPVPGSRYPAQE